MFGFQEGTKIPAAELEEAAPEAWREMIGVLCFAPSLGNPPGLLLTHGRDPAFATGLEVITFPSVSRRECGKVTGTHSLLGSQKHQTPAENKSPHKIEIQRHFSAAMVNEDF